MGFQPGHWLAYLPFAIFALVMLWRFRSLNRARPLRVATLWIFPVVVLGLVSFALYGMHPTAKGWLLFVGGTGVGAMLGWQRARMMRLHIEGEGAEARVMMRQSVAALVMILAIFVLRRFLLSGVSPAPGSRTGGDALLVTDAMLGFAVGVICVQRVVLWLRARRLVVQHRSGDCM
ncbi:CcdC protein domain-containing protein [Novosphingobium album (ex Hu et al. 2023)]|uniref:DUF1453 family protein n=1 Tax=Novosphingobium album (ex Hu et al. 2023) TaxID=2930093 RepID=A0ABT0AYR4_9SPHN|nr:CcdC protein domain-containing protein [Novosphingobium album (ex Hu et al. 2023)]MCJ2177938.1 DUF1453 family protein [Novosphingobium album (ex Hu et al. 2023)]